MNKKKLLLYLLLSFGISWLAALIMFLLDIRYGGIALTVIIGLAYMPGPAIATFIVQKLIYKERFRQYGWTFSFKNYKAFLKVVLLYVLLITFTFFFIALLGNTGIIRDFGSVDFSNEGFMNRFNELIQEKTGSLKIALPQIPALVFFFVSIAQGILAGITINLPFMFGEEFGWRGLMQKEMQSMGFIKSAAVIGIVWGIWHAPIILMGHNYPDFPWIGLLLMCLFTISLSPLFSYVRIKTKSIVGPCMLHGMINATASLFVLFVNHQHQLFSSIAGLAGILAAFLLFGCIWFFDRSTIKGNELAEH